MSKVGKTYQFRPLRFPGIINLLFLFQPSATPRQWGTTTPPASASTSTSSSTGTESLRGLRSSSISLRSQGSVIIFFFNSFLFIASLEHCCTLCFIIHVLPVKKSNILKCIDGSLIKAPHFKATGIMKILSQAFSI